MLSVNPEGHTRSEALELCRGIIASSTPALLGAHLLLPYLHELRLDRDARFTRLIGIASETDSLPLHPSDRKNWSSLSLAAKDVAISEAEARFRPAILACCEALALELESRREPA